MPSEIGPMSALEGVEILRWPRDAQVRRQLARVGVPRVILCGPGVGVPAVEADPAEAWVVGDRPVGDIEQVAVRLLFDLQQVDSSTLTVDANGVARRGDRDVGLSPSEARVVAVLVAEPGRVVSRNELRDVLRSGTAMSVTERALEGVIYRLRQRLVTLHVVIRTVRSRGYAIDL